MTTGIFVEDLEVTAKFFETFLGWRRSSLTSPNCVIFDTKPIPTIFQLASFTNDDYSGMPRSGWGIRPVLQTESSREFFEIRERLRAAKYEVGEVFQTPMGPSFRFVDPNGYHFNIVDGS